MSAWEVVAKVGLVLLALNLVLVILLAVREMVKTSEDMEG